MRNIFKIALRNILRYRRRSILTVSLITVGVIFVLVFISVSGSFKNMIIGEITDSMLGHIQIHKTGYVSSLENLPLTLMLDGETIGTIESILEKQKRIEAFSKRIKFGGMLSNFTETTSIRLNGIYPDKEFKVTPLLPARIIEGNKTLQRGGILIPELLSKGMKLKPGDPVVVISTNKDGSVNGAQFIVAGILRSVTGPGGRDGYIHFEDAVELLRMEKIEISEFALRLHDFSTLKESVNDIRTVIKKKKQLYSSLEVHTWDALSPFSNIAKMIDVMTLFIKIMLVAIVLISILNVMMMAVYERIREIGTIAAIGTLPGKILSMFMAEGIFMGLAGSVFGTVLGVIIVFIINKSQIQFSFGLQSGLILKADVNPYDLIVITIIVLIISLAASIQPAFKASRMEPIQALRHV